MNQQQELCSKVEISIGCRNLFSRDVTSKSDPMAVLYQQINNKFVEIGRTETILNDHNPNFSKKFILDYYFELRQVLKVDIYDSDSGSSNLVNHDYLGSYKFSLGQLVSRGKLEDKLEQHSSSHKQQWIVLNAVEWHAQCKELIVLSLSGSKLDKKDTFGKSDPFLEFWRCDDSVDFVAGTMDYTSHTRFSLVYRNEPIMNTLNPNWAPITVHLNQLCLANKNKLLKIICYDWDSDGGHDVIGQFYTSVNDMEQNVSKIHYFKLINPKKLSKKKNYENSGSITINKMQSRIDYSFLDFISAGTELNFSVAIDFTASNGNPRSSGSLHFLLNTPPAIPGDTAINVPSNQYEVALSAVGSIIQDYDSDKMFPGLGFGCKIPPYNQVSHCFPLTLQNNNPFCAGVAGLMSAYRLALNSVQLFGPTYFTPVIKHVAQFANQHNDGSKYFVLLIITDGIITDLEETIEAICDCSHLPMSLIIVGVGQEDFSAMDILDCDKGRLRMKQKVAIRDIVQFVAMRDFVSRHQSEHYGPMNHDALTKAVLHELPHQLTEWMRLNNKTPLPATAQPPIQCPYPTS